MSFWSDVGLRLGRGLTIDEARHGAAEKDVVISEEDSVSAEDESNPLSSLLLSSKDDDESEEEKKTVDKRESEGIPASFLSPGVRFLSDCSANTPNPRFWQLVRDCMHNRWGHSTHHSQYIYLYHNQHIPYFFACCSRIALDTSILGRKVWTRASTSGGGYYLQYGRAWHKVHTFAGKSKSKNRAIIKVKLHQRPGADPDRRWSIKFLEVILWV